MGWTGIVSLYFVFGVGDFFMNEYEVEYIDDFYKVAYVTPKSKEILEGLLRKSRNIIDIHSFLNEMYRNSERKISANVLKKETRCSSSNR